ncbi:MAG: tripartite tricarboxylate transporter substrate binding protein [Pigmentiphaga sp.]|uniref:Bug family tripartite tricarboxylate transporter substrate binding protein n=1 Tax=Pigmentiphaga sp. TaxID=1977564 RepID=UPI0029BBFCD4|nr:tripartite tricarboxylate transporter substrate binding protein [Pigmentiphaga sp.]MDX3906303.1 tripartite tricarboxylate transporter substrate binding protein [Pigmentiphaga sp.]
MQLTLCWRLAIAAVALACSPAVQGEEFPARPIRLLTPYPAGLTPDVATRIMAEKLGKLWGKPLVIEAKPGANGFLAFGAAKQAAPDGYTLLVVGDAHMTTNPKLLSSVPYDPQKDFEPVSLFFRAPFLFYTSAASPYASMRDLIEAARKDPKKITYGTPYVGSPAHFGGATLAQATGTQMMPVHYKEGAQIYTAVANGDISFSVATIGSGLPLVKAGRMKMLATASAQRLADYPAVPTVRESGGPDLVVETWVGLVAPAGTPAAVVQKLNAGIAQVLKDPELIEKFAALGIAPQSSSPAELATRVRDELAAVESRIKRLGITIE